MATTLVKGITFGSIAPVLLENVSYTVYDAQTDTVFAGPISTGIHRSQVDFNGFWANVSVPDAYIIVWNDAGGSAPGQDQGNVDRPSPSSLSAMTPNPQLLTVADVKSHLVGLGPWLTAAASSVARYDDNIIAQKIAQEVRQFERTTKFRINPVQVVSNPDGTFDNNQAEYSTLGDGGMLLFEDGYPYRREMAQEYFTIQLRQWPVVNVQRVRVMVGQTTVFTMPTNWYSVERRTGVFSIQPVYGPLLISSLAAFSALEFTFGPKDYLRNCIHIDYQVGLQYKPGSVDWTTIPDFGDIAKCLSQLAAAQVLRDVRELADAGLVSVSAGGDSRTYSRFDDRIKQLEMETAKFIDVFVGDETPPILLGYA